MCALLDYYWLENYIPIIRKAKRIKGVAFYFPCECVWFRFATPPYTLLGDIFYTMEIWKDIPWYEGKYQASNFGRIKSLYKKNHIIMKPWIEWSWYSYLILWANKKWKPIKVHRAVMFAFFGEDKDKKFVNHKDWNKQNNRLENLEWVTRSENDKHKYRILWHKTPFQINPYMKWVYWELHPLSKKVKQYSLDWIFIKEWIWIKQAARITWANEVWIIRSCKWLWKQSWWFHWEY